MIDKFGFEQALIALRGLDEATRDRILEEIFQKNPEMAEKLRASLFTFNDIAKINPKGLQTLFKKFELNQWALALRNADDDLVLAIKKNVSTRMFDQLKELIDEIGPQPLKRVQEAQGEILDATQELKDRGIIVLVEDDNDPLV